MAKRHFLSPKEKAELGMTKSKPTPQKGSPEYKIQKLQSTTWLLLVASFVAVILGIAITWSIGYSPALGFAKLKPVFWIPLLFSMIPLTLVVFSIL